MKKNNFDFKAKPLRLSIYFAVVMSIIIIITTTLFAIYALFNTKNLAGEYESEIYKLRYSLSTILVQSLISDTKKQDFTSTNNIINILRDDNLLAYAYVKNNQTNDIVLGSQNNAATNIGSQGENVQSLSRVVDKYTVFFGIPGKTDKNFFYNSFYKMISNILLIFILFGMAASVIMSGIISKPLEQLSKVVKEFSNGNFDAKIDNSNFQEINDLIYSYSEMSKQLNELYTSLEQKVEQRTKELAEANYQLQETQAMMVHSEKMRSLGELVAGIAHEINNPVNFIHGNIMILQNYVDDMLRLIDLYDEYSINYPQDIKDKIEALKKEIDLDFLRDDIKDLIKSCTEGTQRTKNIIIDLKNFSRMEEHVLTELDIPKEIDTTLNILNNKFKNRINVIKNYDEGVPKIEAYGGQLNQVFMNILDNAQDAMQDNGELTINIARARGDVKIEFIDNGKGISEENLKKVFDPFFTTKAVGKGTGLGMSISYRIITSHNGTINVESEVGKGTKFTITLPINQPRKDEY